MTRLIDNTRKTYFSPDDDTQNAFLQFLQSATKKILIADYSFNLQPVVDLLISKHQSGIEVRLILDRTQAAGRSEEPEVQQLRSAGIPLAVGTSSLRKIMHNKFTIVDDTWVESGSWNYTGTASKEDNFFDIENSPDRAVAFATYWQKMHDWIAKNESGGISNE